jgi:hypothetical protein
LPETEATIDPSELSEYLTSRGWRREGSWRGAGVWVLESYGRLLIPDRREFQDDGELLADAVQKLAGYEERSNRDVLLDIAEPMVDAQYFRMHPEAPPGTTPLPSGVRAAQGIHELMKTAARISEEGPRILFEGHRSRHVENFLQMIMLGSGAPGSYVLTSRVPVRRPRPPQLDLWSEDTVDEHSSGLEGRDVMSKLHRAVVAARNAAESFASGRGRIDAFDDRLAEGISANLCQALADLGGHAKNRPFEIGFTWARGLPGHEPTQPVSFTGPMARALARAGDELERLAKSGHARIIGMVETLNISPGEAPRIKIVGEFRGDGGAPVQRSLWVVVSMTDYNRAIDAQRSGWSLDVEGRLVTANRRRELRPERFDVRRPEQLT